MNEEVQTLIQLTVGGIAIGGIYAIIALGFVLIYKATDVFNFAQGELMMVGAYVCFTLVCQIQLGFLPSFLLTLVFSALFGVFLEAAVLRPLLGEPIFSLIMVTVGLAVILRGLVGLLWGHDIHEFPPLFKEEAVNLGGVFLLPVQIWSLAATAFLVAAFYLFFKKTRIGIGMRATANDQNASLLMGISVKRIFSLSWAIASVVASIGSIFYVQLLFLSPDMSFVGIRAFPAAILGGLDSVPGAILGGIIIGVAENLAGGYLDKVMGGGIKEITSFMILILILMIRPYGIFGKREIVRV